MNEPAPPEVGQNLVPVASLDAVGRRAFANCKTLNRIQSVVFETAYRTNENLLICAPTGAGKTNIAMLTIVHQIKQFIGTGNVLERKDQFKVHTGYMHLRFATLYSFLMDIIRMALSLQ